MFESEILFIYLFNFINLFNYYLFSFNHDVASILIQLLL